MDSKELLDQFWDYLSDIRYNIDVSFQKALLSETQNHLNSQKKLVFEIQDWLLARGYKREINENKKSTT